MSKDYWDRFLRGFDLVRSMLDEDVKEGRLAYIHTNGYVLPVSGGGSIPWTDWLDYRKAKVRDG